METKSDIFNKFKSFFVVTDGESEKQEIKNESKESTTVQDNSTKEIKENNVNDGLETVQASDKFIDLLLSNIEKNNLQGFDYLEFRSSLKSIEGMIPDEKVRYNSSFEMGKTMGLTKATLLSSANHYLQVLKEESKKFSDAVQTQKSSQIDTKANQLQQLEKDVQQKKDQIITLQNQIKEVESQLSDLRNEIDSAIVKIEQTNQQFIASYSIVENQLKEDISKIETLIV